jgi:NAD(P)-dependent dehydrogenase (short-subunit alcohol dehydrogenase family)
MLAKDNPSGRLIKPEEVAAVVLGLCSPASASVNGQAIEVTGGPQ